MNKTKYKKLNDLKNNETIVANDNAVLIWSAKDITSKGKIHQFTLVLKEGPSGDEFQIEMSREDIDNLLSVIQGAKKIERDNKRSLRQ